MLDITKPVQTRDGNPVRLVCTDRKGKYSLIGLVQKGAAETIHTWSTDGSRFDIPGTSDTDLVNAPIMHHGWINLFRNGPEDGDCCTSGPVWPNKYAAELAGKAHQNFVAAIKVKWEE